MPTAILPYLSSRFEYARFGSGPQVAVCFHGYGEQADSFAFLEKQLGEAYTLIAINLPCHGHTQWKEAKPFTPQHLLQVIDAIFRQLGLAPRRFTLAGYSMGGRVALSLATAAPEKTDRLCLLAPDGMKMNGWYWLSTQTYAGNRLFRFTMRHPGWFMGMIKTAYRLGLINASIGKFLDYYIGDPLVRQQLYERWTCMRRFTPDLRQLQRDIHRHRIPVRMLYGKYDRIIVAARAEPFVRAIGPHGSLQVLSAGHQLLQKRYADTIAAMLLR